MASRSQRSGTILVFVLLLFFASGFSALLYQTIWQRLLGFFSGLDVYSVTITVAAFMGGPARIRAVRARSPSPKTRPAIAVEPEEILRRFRDPFTSTHSGRIGVDVQPLISKLVAGNFARYFPPVGPAPPVDMNSDFFPNMVPASP